MKTVKCMLYLHYLLHCVILTANDRVENTVKFDIVSCVRQAVTQTRLYVAHVTETKTNMLHNFDLYCIHDWNMNTKLEI